MFALFAATNQDLKRMAQIVKFREDFTTVECFPDLSATPARKESHFPNCVEYSLTVCRLDGQIDRIDSSGNHPPCAPLLAPATFESSKLHAVGVILS